MKDYVRLVANHKRPGRFLVARLLMATGWCRFFRIKQRGYDLRFHEANLSSQLWIDPDERGEALAFLRDFLKPGDRVVDVGANIGETVLTASVGVGVLGHVVGIEAHPRIFRCLQENLLLNGVTNGEVINSAVGAFSGIIRFSDDRHDDMNRVDGGELEVKIDRLDNLVPGVAAVMLFKIDVEGYEKFVLEGASSVLERTQCVHIEVSAIHFRRYGYSTRDVLTLLSAAGFSLFRFREPKCLASITTDFDTESVENLVGLRDVEDCRRRTGWTIRES